MYTITNKTTGETIEVQLHTAGEGYSDFAPVSYAGTPAWTDGTATLYRFTNDMVGDLSSDEWDIAPSIVEPIV